MRRTETKPWTPKAKRPPGRRIGRFLLLLAALAFAARAFAAPATPYAPETVVSALPLSEQARALVDALYPAIVRCEEKIELPEGTRYDDVNAAMASLTADYPELIHLARQWQIGYYRDRPEVATSLLVDYTLSADAYAAERARLMSVAKAMVAQTGGGAVDRAEALHDLLCARVTYAASAESGEGHTAADALLMAGARCEGYAQALTLLYRLAGLPCGMVIGDAWDDGGRAESHAWNVAILDGTPTFIDATWDDQPNGDTHWYFGLTGDMMAADHRVRVGDDPPACDDMSVNWHARRGLLIATPAELTGALARFAQEGEVSLRFRDAELYEDFLASQEDWFRRMNAERPDAAFYGTYAVACCAAQRCVMLWRKEDLQ